jgi:hypothetical protein
MADRDGAVLVRSRMHLSLGQGMRGQPAAATDREAAHVLALARCGDLLLCAKHLFIAAMTDMRHHRRAPSRQ